MLVSVVNMTIMSIKFTQLTVCGGDTEKSNGLR